MLHVGTVMTWTNEVTTCAPKRQQTPPTLKWLLNERAALLGQVTRLDAQLGRAREEALAAANEAARLAARVRTFEEHRRTAAASAAALDVVLSTTFPNAQPDAAGVVNAWAGRYGPYGGLKRYLLDTLNKAAPAALSTGELMSAAEARFRLDLQSRAERDTFRFHLRRALRTAGHLVEEVPAQGKGGALRWRWKGNPSLAALTDEVGRSEHATRTDAIGTEVGSQRAGGDGG